MRELLLTVATVAGLFLLVPLIVWAGSGSWRHAWYALKQYLGIMGTLAATGAVLALIIAAGELF